MNSSSWLNKCATLFTLIVLVRPAFATQTFPNPQPQGKSWELCSLAIADITAEGNGTTIGSCLSCSPTTDICASKCQPLIDVFFEACDGTVTPPDKFFDPANTIDGGWDENAEEIRIAVFRCGCNNANTMGFDNIGIALVVLVMLFIR